ncbi:MAG: hypothetical protein QXI37_04380 [Thermoprotei archaeon]
MLFVMLVGGGASLQGVPYSFHRVSNPSSQPQDYYPSSYGAFYNQTLTLLSLQKFHEVSIQLGLTSEINYLPSITSTVQAANSEIAQMNKTIPEAQNLSKEALSYFANTSYPNSIAAANEACTYAALALESFKEFANVSTLRMEQGGVPVQLYSKAENKVGSLVLQTYDTCLSVTNQIQSALNSEAEGFSFVIGSPERSFETGGPLSVYGSLTEHGAGVEGVPVEFYLNGLQVGSATTGRGGGLNLTLRAPYIYSSPVNLSAYAERVQGFPGMVSNTLTLYVNYTSTRIVLADPPSVLPGFSFPLEGVLESAHGPIPYAPVNVSAFGLWRIVRTDSTGRFGLNLTVPENASNGVHEVHVRFAPEGVLGPSFNVTSVNVYRLPVQLTVSVGRAVAGLPDTVSGTVHVNGSPRPLAFTVYVETPWETYVLHTTPNGDFSASVPVPLGYFSSAQLNVKAVANQSFTSPASSSLKLGVLNPLPYVAAAALALLAIYEVRATWPEKRPKTTGTGSPPIAEDVAASVEKPKAPTPLTVGETYLRTVALVASAAHVSVAPNLTMRETLSALVRTKEGDRVKQELTRLTELAEEDAYSKDSKATVAEALSLFERVSAALGSVT